VIASAAGRHGYLPIAVLATFHLAALALLVWSEHGVVSIVAYLLAWGLLNCFWIIVLRRPMAAAAMSLAMIVVLILLARLKQSVLFIAIDFVDLMIIDLDTARFLLTIYPDLPGQVAIALGVGVPLFAFLLWYDPFRVRLRTAFYGFAFGLAAFAAMSVVAPKDPHNDFDGGEHVSKFARSGATAIGEYFRHGLFDSAARVEPLPPVGPCRPAGKLPNIIMVFDESSFDITIVPGVKAPPEYKEHFKSSDGKQRTFVVEGVGGPSWFTEYNVLTGLTTRSYGRFADFVTRIASGRVERGLAYSLRRCGYTTFSHYPFLGSFLSARSFQRTAGIEHFRDMKEIGAKTIEPDFFYYDAATKLFEQERGKGPVFLMLYLAINHFPWVNRYHPELLPEWQDPGNAPIVDEYLRRQTMSAKAYSQFEERLRREFPDEQFLIVRFGDHLPGFAPYLIQPELEAMSRARRFAVADPRLRETYYAINFVNYKPADMTAALDRLEAAYLPLVVQELAGVPLDATFAEQKRIFQRCRGAFATCDGGAEVRRFNRQLIDAGYIKGM
jgi:hypothetical protein